MDTQSDWPSGRPAVSVIIPTLNEVGNIDLLLRRVNDAMLGGDAYEVIVVDDGSTDGTREAVEAWSERGTVRLVKRDGERGLSGAVVRGAQQASGRVVVVMDADLSHPPEVLPELIGKVLDGSHDVAIGSRHTPGGRVVGWPLRRHVTSRIAAALATPFVDVHDPMSGFFATRRELLTELDPEDPGFKVLLEVLVRRSDRDRVCEVPIEFRDREHGESKLNGRVVWSYLRQLVGLSALRVGRGSATRFAFVGLMGVGVDLGLFSLLLWQGVALGNAHIASFLVASVFNYVLNDLWTFGGREGGRPGLRRYAAFLGVCIAALFLRGGVLAAAVSVGLPPVFGVVLGIVVAAGVNYFASALLVFSGDQPGKTVAQWRLVALAVVGYALLLRLAYAGVVDLLPEEAYYWNYAQRLDIGYLDHPPMVAWLIALSTGVFGDTEFAVRLPAILCWMVALVFVVQLAVRLVNRSAGFAAAAIFSVLPFYFVQGTIMTPDAPLLACWAAGLFFLHSALVRGNHRSWLWFGMAVGLGMLSKYTIGLLPMVALVLVLLDGPGRRVLLTRWPYLSAGVAAVVCSPVVIWNAMNGWASFEFQTVRRLAAEPEFGLPVLIGSMLALLSPVGILSALRALGVRSLDRGSLGFADRRFLFVGAAAPLTVFVVYSLNHQPQLNWTGPLWLALIPLMTMDFRPVAERMRSVGLPTSLPAGWTVSAAVLLLGFGGMLHYLSLGLPQSMYPERMPMPVAWEEVAIAIEEIEDRLEARIGSEPIVVGMDKYHLASQVAFYRAKHEGLEDTPGESWNATTSRHLFGMSALMYEYWFEPLPLAGSTVIMVAFDKEDIDDESIGAWFTDLSDIEELPIRKNNRAVHTFYWRIGTGYHARADGGNGMLLQEPLRLTAGERMLAATERSDSHVHAHGL